LEGPGRYHHGRARLQVDVQERPGGAAPPESGALDAQNAFLFEAIL
jgi:hypothetical protein